MCWCFQEEGPKEDEESDDKSVSEVSEEEDADDGSDEVRSLILLSRFTSLFCKLICL